MALLRKIDLNKLSQAFKKGSFSYFLTKWAIQNNFPRNYKQQDAMV